MTFEIDNYSAIITVGGDGTIHQALHGLLSRPDGKRVPIGFLPNGSGDDTCGSLGIQVNDIDMGLEYIFKGDVIKMDIIKILLDHESEQEIQATIEKDPSKKSTDYLRYSLINTSFCLSANTNKHAGPMKKYVGQAAYTI